MCVFVLACVSQIHKSQSLNKLFDELMNEFMNCINYEMFQINSHFFYNCTLQKTGDNRSL